MSLRTRHEKINQTTVPSMQSGRQYVRHTMGTRKTYWGVKLVIEDSDGFFCKTMVKYIIDLHICEIHLKDVQLEQQLTSSSSSEGQLENMASSWLVLLHVVGIIVIVAVLNLPTNEPENTCEQAGSASMPKTTTPAPGE